MQASERRYLKPRFHILEEMGLTLRCAFCDHEQTPAIISRASTKKYRSDPANWREVRFDYLLFFTDEDAARAAGHQPRKTAPRHPSVDQPVST